MDFLMMEVIRNMLQLSHELGVESRQLAILGEGNTSAWVNDHSFMVKASGSSLRTLSEEDVTVCRFDRVLAVLEDPGISDEALNQALMDSRMDSEAKKPSLETMFHAWLLKLDGVRFVGHCHPVSCNQVLCSPLAHEFAVFRSCPDEVVCCGEESVFVEYADPGLPLAMEIVQRTRRFMKQTGAIPRLICLKNHGIIALGPTWNSVLTTILMADKAATIFVGAAALGGPDYLSPSQVRRLAGRADEAYRQRQLGMR